MRENLSTDEAKIILDWIAQPGSGKILLNVILYNWGDPSVLIRAIAAKLHLDLERLASDENASPELRLFLAHVFFNAGYNYNNSPLVYSDLLGSPGSNRDESIIRMISMSIGYYSTQTLPEFQNKIANWIEFYVKQQADTLPEKTPPGSQNTEVIIRYLFNSIRGSTTWTGSLWNAVLSALHHGDEITQNFAFHLLSARELPDWVENKLVDPNTPQSRYGIMLAALKLPWSPALKDTVRKALLSGNSELSDAAIFAITFHKISIQEFRSEVLAVVPNYYRSPLDSGMRELMRQDASFAREVWDKMKTSDRVNSGILSVLHSYFEETGEWPSDYFSQLKKWYRNSDSAHEAWTIAKALSNFENWPENDREWIFDLIESIEHFDPTLINELIERLRNP